MTFFCPSVCHLFGLCGPGAAKCHGGVDALDQCLDALTAVAEVSETGDLQVSTSGVDQDPEGA